MFLIQQVRVGCNLSAGGRMGKGGDFDVGICSLVEEYGVVIALTYRWSFVDSSCM